MNWGFASARGLISVASADWLSRELCPTELRREQLRDAVIARCRAQRMEPPTFGQIARLVNSAVRTFEERFCGVTENRLDAEAGVVGRLEGTVNLLKLSGGMGMVGSGGSVCVACVRPLWPCR